MRVVYGKCIIEDKNTIIPETEQTEQDCPTFVQKIGNTTYVVGVHFSEGAKETMQQKIERLLRNEIKYGND